MESTDFSAIKEKLQQGIDKIGVTKCLKIQFLRPGPGTRIEVIFESKTQAEKARKHTQWATGQFHGVRVQGEKWYPVKCDMVAKQAVLDRTATDDKTLSRTVCENFSKDNQAEGIDFTVTKVPWLSKADYKKKVGSLVIWLKSKFAADHLLKSGTAIFGATGAYCSKWEVKANELPCFNCNTYGHKQAECTSIIKCALCSGPHSRHNCPKKTIKCPACHKEGHTVFDWQCSLHPKNWMFKGKTRELIARKTGQEQGTTRVSQEIIAKQNANRAANELERSQHVPAPADRTEERTPALIKSAVATPKAASNRRQANMTAYTASQPATQAATPTVTQTNVREVNMIDADSNASSDE